MGSSPVRGLTGAKGRSIAGCQTSRRSHVCGNEVGMARCAGCPGLQGPLHSKLGTCARCMRIAAAGTLAGWGLVAATRVLGAPRGVVGLLALVAAQFTLILILHL